MEMLWEKAREIGRRHRIPVTSCAHAQMLVAQNAPRRRVRGRGR